MRFLMLIYTYLLVFLLLLLLHLLLTRYRDGPCADFRCHPGLSKRLHGTLKVHHALGTTGVLQGHRCPGAAEGGPWGAALQVTGSRLIHCHGSRRVTVDVQFTEDAIQFTVHRVAARGPRPFKSPEARVALPGIPADKPAIITAQSHGCQRADALLLRETRLPRLHNVDWLISKAKHSL